MCSLEFSFTEYVHIKVRWVYDVFENGILWELNLEAFGFWLDVRVRVRLMAWAWA